MFGGRSARDTARTLYDINASEQLRREVAGALTRAVAPGVYRPGGITMRGKAAKHLRLLGRTLVVVGEPDSVAAVVAAPVQAAKAKFAPSAELEPGEAAAWEAGSVFGAFPRLVVRRSPLVARATEVGATRFKMSLRFPQGGPFVDRGVTAALDALREHGFVVSEQTRAFVPGPDVAADGDGVWVAGDLVAEPAVPS